MYTCNLYITCQLYLKSIIEEKTLPIPRFHPRQRDSESLEVALRRKWVSFFFYLLTYLFIYFWLCWVFVAALGLSLAAVSGDYPGGAFSCCSAQAPEHRLVIVTHGLHCPTTCRIFPDQGLNHVPGIGRRTLDHWTTRKVPYVVFICV